MKTELTVNWHCSQCESTFDELVNPFVSSFATGKKFTKTVSGFSGRILRGINDIDFLSLTDNPNRRVVLLLDSLALCDLVGLNGKEILMKIGYDNAYISELLSRETRFKLAIIPETSVKLATLDNLIDTVQSAYPEWKGKLELSRPILKSENYKTVIERGGIPKEVREFLYETLNINYLFSGTGIIRNEISSSGIQYKEYVTTNQNLANFNAYALVEFPI